MASVTIRGSITPSAWLPRGEVKTVQRTQHIENLIRQGFVDVLEEHPDTPAAPAVLETPVVETPTPTPETPPAEAPPTTTPYTLDKPPSKGGSREDWAEFLSSYPEISIVTEGKTRDQLVGEWETWQDEHADAKA